MNILCSVVYKSLFTKRTYVWQLVGMSSFVSLFRFKLRKVFSAKYALVWLKPRVRFLVLRSAKSGSERGFTVSAFMRLFTAVNKFVLRQVTFSLERFTTMLACKVSLVLMIFFVFVPRTKIDECFTTNPARESLNPTMI